MVIDELIAAAAQNRAPSITLIKEFCKQESLSLPAFFDRFAERIASRYLSGTLTWKEGDLAMNQASFLMATHCHPIADYAHAVFLAFDAGEIPPGQAITKPLLEEAEAKRAGRSAPEATAAILRIRSDSTERDKQQAVSLARQTIDGKLGLIAGCRLLKRLSHSLAHGYGAEEAFLVFGNVDSQTDDLPLADMRDKWDASAFAAKQVEVKRAEEEFRTVVIQACNSIITRFGA
jgi:hypothetical protein